MSDLRYQLMIDGQVSGPHSLLVLREMASVHAFSVDTLITPENAGIWRAVREDPELFATLFPSTPKLQLKAKVITLTEDSTTPVSVEAILRDNLAAENRRGSRTTHDREKSPPPFDAPAASFPTPMPVADRPPGRARRRDFLITILACDVFAGAAWHFLPHNPVLLVFLLSLATVTNISLYWIFYHVMDRY